MAGVDPLLEFNEELLKFLEPSERRELEILLAKSRAQTWDIWKPLPGPQTMAYYSEADVVGYGGAAGGGKTDLAIGLTLTNHHRVGIFRQNGTELTAVIDRFGEILGGRDGFNGADKIWRITRPNGSDIQIELGSFPSPGDEKKYRGRPHDLLIFDEAADMRVSAVRFLMGWLRSVNPRQRKRVLMCFNPPTTTEGRWVVEYFAPWLDKHHPNPAEPGELRWFARIDGKEREVDGPEVFEHNGENVIPQSRTFIASRVADNPHLAGTNYEAQLQSLPEPLRSQMLYGDFKAGMQDDPMQVVPTAWVEAAMDRWEPKDILPEMSSMGVDVAMGGDDKTVIARRHEWWFDEMIYYAGRDCPNGPTIASYVLKDQRDRAPIHIDLFGVGAQPYGHLMRLGAQVHGINVGDPSGGTSKDGGIRFRNLRTELWWRVREALDPAANNGIQLPKDRQLLSDLCAPLWKHESGIIQVEGRDQIVKRLGRSPDAASALCLAMMDTMKQATARELLRGPKTEYDPYAHI